jgi:hypothetical protein
MSSEMLLIIIPGYVAPGRGESFNDAGFLGNMFVQFMAAIRNAAMREHVRFYRDFYANPRSSAYMVERLNELFEKSKGQIRTLVVGSRIKLDMHAAKWAHKIRQVDESVIRSPNDLLHGDYDAVLLVTQDPLGLGLGAFERALDAAYRGKIFVMNGRRQVYRLDGRMQRVLGRRRVLAETRIVESILSRVVPIIGFFLATRDRLTHKS